MEKSKVERSIERKLKNKGFEVILVKQYISKTIYNIVKDNRQLKVEVPSNVTDTNLYANMLETMFNTMERANG